MLLPEEEEGGGGEEGEAGEHDLRDEELRVDEGQVRDGVVVGVAGESHLEPVFFWQLVRVDVVAHVGVAQLVGDLGARGGWGDGDVGLPPAADEGVVLCVDGSGFGGE